MENRIGIIIQVRTGSTRLPNKSILPFYNNKGVFELLIEKLLHAVRIPIIVATTTNSNDDIIEEIVKSFSKVNLYRGSECNVLSRFIGASNMYSLSKVIRICSDNPFLESYALNNLINEFLIRDLDYLGYKVDGVPSIKTHYGFWAEAVSINALVKTAELTSDKLYLEHVTNYIYSNPKIFNVDFININYALNNKLRLTMDTIEDFVLQKIIFEYLIKKYPSQNYRILDILNYLDMNKEFYNIMYLQKLSNSK